MCGKRYGDNMDVNYNTQSALSIPLSNIVESGKNYIRFSDGTQICFSYQLMTYANEVKVGGSVIIPITYAKPFISYPILMVTTLDGHGDPNELLESCYPRNIYVGAVTTSLTKGCCILTNNSHMSINQAGINYIAIGKWK